jgi:hypothetical protein
MLIARLSDQLPGAELSWSADGESGTLTAEILSEHPIAFCELIRNGIAVTTYMGRSEALPDGGYRMQLSAPVSGDDPGWVALRIWENRDSGRFRFAHTAPWWVNTRRWWEGANDDDVALRPEERDYLINRVQAQIDRSRDVLDAAALDEYQTALTTWELLAADDDPVFAASDPRETSPSDRFDWFRNMLVYHRFSDRELAEAIGVTPAELETMRYRSGWTDVPAAEFPDNQLVVLPYPGGRHPRTGFLDGALNPQRETKISVFLPWARPDFDPPGSRGYVVVDVPEAIFTNLGLTYLAHTHVPTIWSDAGTTLEPLEWTVTDDGLELERLLPNGIRFGSNVSSVAGSDGRLPHVAMELWLTNGTSEPLTGMRVQNCVMLKAATGFHDQTNSNKLLRDPFVAVHDETGRYWIITAWTPNHRAWANPPVPCLHSDPVFRDCPPGETVRAHGRLWFYEGTDIDAELTRLAQQLSPAE